MAFSQGENAHFDKCKMEFHLRKIRSELHAIENSISPDHYCRMAYHLKMCEILIFSKKTNP